MQYGTVLSVLYTSFLARGPSDITSCRVTSANQSQREHINQSELESRTFQSAGESKKHEQMSASGYL